ATATDAAGNVSSASGALAVTVDTTAPAAPTIATYSADTGVAGDGITSDNTLTLAGSAEANSTVKLFDGATLIGSVTANASGAWSYTTAALADDIHHLTATAIDAAGNVSSASGALAVTVDTTAPAAPTIATYSADTGVAGDGITSDNTLTLAGSAEAKSTVKLFDGATLIGSVTANASGAWSYTTAALADGTHDFTANATDAAGNVSLTSTHTDVSVDGPQASVEMAVTDLFMSSNGTALFTGTTHADSTISLNDSNTGASLGHGTAAPTGLWAIVMTNLSDAVHSYTVTATDQTGVGIANVVSGTSGN